MAVKPLSASRSMASSQSRPWTPNGAVAPEGPELSGQGPLRQAEGFHDPLAGGAGCLDGLGEFLPARQVSSGLAEPGGVCESGCHLGLLGIQAGDLPAASS